MPLAQTVEIFNYTIMQTSDMPRLGLALFQIRSHFILLSRLSLCLGLEINATVATSVYTQTMV